VSSLRCSERVRAHCAKHSRGVSLRSRGSPPLATDANRDERGPQQEELPHVPVPRRPLGDVRADGARAGVQHRLPHQRVDEAVRASAELRRLANSVPGAGPRHGDSGPRASSDHLLGRPAGRFASTSRTAACPRGAPSAGPIARATRTPSAASCAARSERTARASAACRRTWAGLHSASARRAARASHHAASASARSCSRRPQWFPRPGVPRSLADADV
jgi:hypothetical protein